MTQSTDIFIRRHNVEHYVRLPKTVMDEAERIWIQKLLTEEAQA